LKLDAIDYSARIASGEPYAGMLSGRLPLVWTHAKVVCDSPNKKNVKSGALAGQLMTEPVADTASASQSEVLLVTPYFIPAPAEMQLLQDLRQLQVRVRILTNSLESSPRTADGAPRLVWHTQEGGNAVDYTREPARSRWQRFKVKLLSLLPLAREL